VLLERVCYWRDVTREDVTRGGVLLERVCY
jgi:hypothetical protein